MNYYTGYREQLPFQLLHIVLLCCNIVYEYPYQGGFSLSITLPSRKSIVVLCFLSWLCCYLCLVHLVLLLWLYLVFRVLNEHVNKYISEELNRCYFIIIVCFVVNTIR